MEAGTAPRPAVSGQKEEIHDYVSVLGACVAYAIEKIHSGLQAVEKVIPAVQKDAGIVEGITALIPGAGAQTAVAIERVAFGVLGDVVAAVSAVDHATLAKGVNVALDATVAAAVKNAGHRLQVGAADGRLEGVAMQSQVDWLDSGGGHITVALFVFLVGVGLLLARIDVGKEIVVGALASLWTSLRNANRESPPT